MSEYVIIGNGVAAAGCIEGIRSVDRETPITVVSEENHPVYGRPLISYMLLGKTSPERMNYRPADFYEKNNCRVLYGKKAVKLDPASKSIELDDGQSLSYRSVCIAAGSRPFVPPFEGLDSVENKFNFMTLDDALALDQAVGKDKSVLLVGGGLIGLKCAEGIAERVKELTVCDLAGRVLSSIMDDECAGMMQKKLEEKGVKFMLGDSAVKFSRNLADMKSGRKVYFDLLILAVGVKANIGLIKDAGGETNRGIIIDDSMKTSFDDVYAAGDCAEGFDAALGAKRVLAILPNAYMQGRTAGRNMAGMTETYTNAMPVNSIGFFGLHAMTAGTYEGDLYEEKSEGKLKRFFVKDGLLKGFMFIGDTEKTGIYTALIRDKTPLDTVNFDLLKEGPTLAAFSAAKRHEMLGGML